MKAPFYSFGIIIWYIYTARLNLKTIKLASEQKFVDYIIHQIGFAEQVTNKKMFGEYGLYFDNKLFGLICDNKLFIKPTQSSRVFIHEVVEASPYPGAKPSFLIEEKFPFLMKQVMP